MNSTIFSVEQPRQLDMQSVIEDSRWQAVLERNGASDGKFVFAVSSTGVYCRPSCPSKRPKRENVTFFRKPQEAESAGYRECLRCRPKAIAGNPRQELIKSVCRYIEQHLDEPVTLSRLGAEFRQSPFHLQRTFKAVLGITPKQYADSCRMRGFRQKLKAGHSVTRAMHDAGYSSTSRLYSRTSTELGMEPAKYRRGAIATPIRYSVTESPIGRMLIAATDKGICSIQFADSDEELEQGLKQEFPFALRRRDDDGMATLAGQVVQRISGVESSASLPLDIQATAFQRRVWSYLQSIAFGKTRSYSEVAKAIRHPSAVRAVARACATNPVAIAIPCHRVLRANGDLGGYRWGMERKKALLEMESAGG
ncbi:MAG TPA: bifunctional DNA-binding transcriptional regulator/O6-methylguanine-DNA methyltransferase Ada [Terriglobales bacterium]|nr:bifunctional DNA-binding transcriptional regulator/O6-methylguanine-DNA methyltransferase Ada [Terriglobales bacterium]